MVIHSKDYQPLKPIYHYKSTDETSETLAKRDFISRMDIILIGGLRFIDGAITLGVLVAFINYNAILFRPVVLLGQFYQQLQDALTGAERVYALLDTPTKVPYNNDFDELSPIKGDVVFNRIKFEYVKDEPIYEKFSL